jgi:uncharacterized membrane protein YfcA
MPAYLGLSAAKIVGGFSAFLSAWSYLNPSEANLKNVVIAGLTGTALYAAGVLLEYYSLLKHDRSNLNSG